MARGPDRPPRRPRCRVAHDLLLEVRRAAPPEAPATAFVEAFDRALSRLNVEYAKKRASKRLDRPCLHLMRPGWSERQCRADLARGKRAYQYKWPAVQLEWDPASRADVLRTVGLAADAAETGGGRAPLDWPSPESGRPPSGRSGPP